MSTKGRILVLRRVRAGDQDLLVRAYGPVGVMDLLVRDGLLNTSAFFGVFEPFNVVEVDLSQRGEVAVPNDVMRVERLSYLCADFDRFRWMCWVARFVLRNVRFYDEKLFELFLSYLTVKGRREEVYRIKLKLEYLEASGLRPRFLGAESLRGKVKVKLSDGSVSPEGDLEVKAQVLRIIRRLYETRRVGRVILSPELAKGAEQLLDRFIEYHSR